RMLGCRATERLSARGRSKRQLMEPGGTVTQQPQCTARRQPDSTARVKLSASRLGGGRRLRALVHGPSAPGVRARAELSRELIEAEGLARQPGSIAVGLIVDVSLTGVRERCGSLGEHGAGARRAVKRRGEVARERASEDFLTE